MIPNIQVPMLGMGLIRANLVGFQVLHRQTGTDLHPSQPRRQLLEVQVV